MYSASEADMLHNIGIDPDQLFVVGFTPGAKPLQQCNKIIYQEQNTKFKRLEK